MKEQSNRKGKELKLHAPAILGLSVIAAMLIAVFSGTAVAATNHEQFFKEGYNGAVTCTEICHKDIDTEVMASVHYQWRTENPLVEFPGGGSHGMIDRACGLVGSNALINFDEQCGRCHISDSLPFPDPQTGQYTDDQKHNLDCLICHAAEGKYDTNNDGVAEKGELADVKPRVFDEARQKWMWHQDRSLEAAKSVGLPVSVDACLRCHHHGQADYQYKRGTPYEPHEDVHAKAGMLCTECHLTENHKIARGSRVTDMFAWERQDVDVKCENCHTEAPHKKTPMLNNHTDKIGCETCHIPELAGAQRRVWTSTFGVEEGPEANVPVYDEASGKWQPYTEYDKTLTTPSYRWFAGGSSMLAEPIATPGAFDMQPATMDTPGAKILPFRKFVSGQPMDGMGLPGMPNFNENFTMAAALEQMAPMLKQAGFMRPEGMTPQEVGMMSQFPNMLLFDREDYFANGDIIAAVSIGMAKQGAFMMGMNASEMNREQLIGMGAGMWSGVVAGLDLPDNPYAPGYLNDQDPTTVTGSYITVSHAIKKDGALNCGDCHTGNGRLDFALLGYSQEKQAQLSDPKMTTDPSLIHATIEEYTGPETCVKCHEDEAKDMFKSAHYQWNGPTPNVPNIDGSAGKGNGSFNTYCGNLDASRRIVCWKCHVGNGAEVEEEQTPMQLRNIDCLMCHQDQYKRKPSKTIPVGDFNKDFNVNFGDFAQMAGAWTETVTPPAFDFTYDGELDVDDMAVFSDHWLEFGGGQKITRTDYQGTERTWALPNESGTADLTLVPDAANMPVSMLEAARTVHMPTRGSCLQCHATAGGGDGLKRGDMSMGLKAPTRNMDVHMSADGANLTCQDCHKTDDHKMLGRGIDLRINDRPERMTCDNLDCHTSRPHESDRLNDHTAKVSCQTCHINTYAKLKPTEVRRDWLDPHWVQGVYSGQGGYKPREHTAGNLTPSYGWFNGKSEIYKLGQVAKQRDDGMYATATPLGDVSDPEAKIYPMKEHTTNCAIHDATGQMIPYATTTFFFTGKFDDAVADGLDELGLEPPYSVVEAHAYQSLNHEVQPKGDALKCAQCHGAMADEGQETRMDLKAMGYGLRFGSAEDVCAQCHAFAPEVEKFEEIHKLHVDVWNINCKACHNFSRQKNSQ